MRLETLTQSVARVHLRPLTLVWCDRPDRGAVQPDDVDEAGRLDGREAGASEAAGP